MFYNARWYDISLSRFAQADTIIPQSQGVQAWDRYAYVNNSPVNYVDPTGHVCSDPEDPTPSCDGNMLHKTKVGNKMIQGGTMKGAKVKAKGGGGVTLDLTRDELDDGYDILSDIIQGNTPSNQEVCEFFLSGASTACNPDAWQEFSELLTDGYGSIGYDLSRVDGIEMLIDIGGIVTDLGLATPFRKQALKAGLVIDTFGLAYQVSKATEGKGDILDLGVSGTLEAFSNSDFITKARPFRGIPVIGLIPTGISMVYNLSSGFYFEPPRIKPNSFR